MADDSTFRAMLAGRIQSYRDHERELQARLGELTTEMESVAARRQAAEELYRTEFGETAEAPVETQQPSPQVGPLTGLSWNEAMTRVLGEAGRPLHVKEIWQLLQEGGFHSGARDPVRSVVAIAVRNGARFPKAGPNRYGLAQVPSDEELGEGAA
jgi:hypothetical protein